MDGNVHFCQASNSRYETITSFFLEPQAAPSNLVSVSVYSNLRFNVQPVAQVNKDVTVSFYESVALQRYITKILDFL